VHLVLFFRAKPSSNAPNVQGYHLPGTTALFWTSTKFISGGTLLLKKVCLLTCITFHYEGILTCLEIDAHHKLPFALSLIIKDAISF
jgi:hypothetical protein